MVGLHVLVAHVVARSDTLARFVEGSAAALIENGRINHEARKRAMISEPDLREALRQKRFDGEGGIGEVKIMTLEPSGKISVVKRSG